MEESRLQAGHHRINQLDSYHDVLNKKYQVLTVLQRDN